MKSRYFLAFALVSVIVLSVTIVEADRGFRIFQPQGNDGTFNIDLQASRSRVIVDSVTDYKITELKEKGCSVKHKLRNSVSFECPENAAVNARPARIFRITDLQADQQINADDVWAQGINGSGVDVVILDTGIDTKHIELNDSVKGCISFVAGESCNDFNGHGTHVAGIITANGVYLINGNYATGVAPGTGIYMLKVCGASGSCLEDDMMAAMEYAVNNLSVKIMSISIGGGNYGSHCDSDPLAAKVNWVVDNGISVAVAAGNDGLGVSSPACASKAIAVGAVNKNDARPWWSNRGSALDIVAPGVDILSAYSCIAAGDCNSYWYAYLSGTSMSTPHVSGVIALLRQKNPSLNDSEVKDALYKTAKDLGTTGWDQYYGWGRIDALGAINYISFPTTTTTTTLPLTTTTTLLPNDTTTTTTVSATTTVPTTSTTTTITTTTLPTTTTTTLPVPTTIFSDGFESGLGNWVQDSQRDWFTSSQRRTQGIRSAEVDGNAIDATITTKNSIDLSSKTSATLTYSWFIENNWDSGEYICLDIFANGAWTSSVRCLDGNVDAEQVWNNENVDLSSYLTNDFKIRFRARVSSSSEDGDVDNVIITAA